MKKYFTSEKGYSLVTVMLIFTLIITVGITLVSVTVNSSKFVSVDKESIEEKTNAENMIEEAMAHIETEIEKVNSSTLNAQNAMQKMNSALDNATIKGINKYTLSSETLKNGENGVFTKKVTIQAPLGDSGKTLTKTIIISTIAEVFQYDAITPGNLILNGASYLEGDVFVGGNLSTNKYGKYIQGGWGGGERWPETSYPAINGTLSVKGNFYRGVRSYSFSEKFTPESTILNKYFSVVPRIKDRNIQANALNYFTFKNNLNLGLSTKSRVPACYDHWYWGRVCPEGDTYYNGKQTIGNGTTYAGDLVIGSNADVTINGNVVVNDDLVIQSGGKLTINGGSIIVGSEASLSGHLSFGSKEDFIYIESFTEITNLDLAGKMFVDDDLYIRDDFNTNGTVFVKNSVDVQNLSNKNDGTLILIANGEIKISNNNEFNDSPKVMDAYFYSNQQLEIYGIGSHLQIKGGIYGNPIILNATKGKTKESYFTNSFREGSLYFESGQDSLEPTKSRLSVIYKKELILNPPTGIPTVDKIQIKELDSVYE
jgi:hypothetical protein